MVAFVKRHRDKLEQLTTSFLSVSLSEAGAKDERRSEDERAKVAVNVAGVIAKFLGETGWRPKRVKALAVAILYSKYNFIIRFVMKRMTKASMATDSSRDYDFTDWKSVDQFVDGVLSDHSAHAGRQDAPAPA